MMYQRRSRGGQGQAWVAQVRIQKVGSQIVYEGKSKLTIARKQPGANFACMMFAAGRFGRSFEREKRETNETRHRKGMGAPSAMCNIKRGRG